MNTTKLSLAGLVAVAATVLFLVSTKVDAQSSKNSVDADDISGVVTSSKGPEAGVWVIAETTDLPTKFSRTVVTDDRGRYVIPDLPAANYAIFARGYGLVDSAKSQAKPGATVDLKPTIAPDAKTAAKLYPASYWYSMMKIPEKSEFPGTGPSGNGISTNIKSQAEYLDLVRTDSCWSCHQLGTEATRTIPAALGKFDSATQAWERRIQSGQAGGQMLGGVNRMGKERTLAMFADWTTRVAAGELPAAAPKRPEGIERNVVITQWDWADPKAYLHDEIASDKRNPTVNANGPLFGSAEESRDYLPVLDPVKNVASTVKVPYRDPATPGQPKPLMPSAYWGEEPIWDAHVTVHNPMLDHKARVWFTSRVRPANANPAFCKAGSNHPSAKVFPLNAAGRHLAMYDPQTKAVKLIGTCFATHHLQFAEDANNTLWTSSGGGGGVVGWLNTKVWEETGDEERAQGWTPLILDYNANGKRDAWTEPDQPADPTKDRRVNAGFYGVAVGADGNIWGSVLGFPGSIVRLTPGANPSETALAEVYELPYGNAKAAIQGYSPRGLDVDRNGVVWAPLASGHFASFDRRKCKAKLNGPTATGQHCPEGWTLHPFPAPQFSNVKENGSAEASYYSWVDQFDTFGLGKNTPIATGNGEDALMAVVNGKFVTLRVPYPLGFFAKGMDGRIDNASAGWKGKGLWSTWATRAPFHSETGKGTQSKVVKFQLRPDPLAH